VSSDYVNRESQKAKIRQERKIIEHRAIRDDLKFMLHLGLVKAESPEYEKFFRTWNEIN
jgi:hypothetical protein